jgi:DNA-binding winged helix-turn-helix (wHTH) protein
VFQGAPIPCQPIASYPGHEFCNRGDVRQHIRARCVDIFTLDLQGCSLLRGDEVRLRPKSFDVLRYLVERAGRLVSKEELIQAIWPDLFVTEDSVVQCIGNIRTALGDATLTYAADP